MAWIGGIVLTQDGHGAVTVESDGVVAWDDAGRIDYCGPRSSWMGLESRTPPLLSESDGRLLITPGLVDTHVHLTQLSVRGQWGYPLEGWLENVVFPEEIRHLDPDYARDAARAFYASLAAVGTTQAMVYGPSSEAAVHACFAEAADMRIRACIGMPLMDVDVPAELRHTPEEAFAACERLHARWDGAGNGLLHAVVTPRYGPSCSPTMLSEAGRVAQRLESRVQTHLSETTQEVQTTLERHPGHASVVDVLENASLLHEKTVLAHAIHVGPEEWTHLAQRGCTVAHCPESNMFLQSGRMKWEEAHQYGLTVSIASDVGAGTTLDLRHACRCALYSHPPGSISLESCFLSITQQAACALGTDETTGRLVPGNEADLALWRCQGASIVESEDAAISCRGLLSEWFFRPDLWKPAGGLVRGHALSLA